MTTAAIDGSRYWSPIPRKPWLEEAVSRIPASTEQNPEMA